MNRKLYPDGSFEPISNDKFIEWTKDIFSEANCPGRRKIIVYSEEVKEFWVSKGVPAECIDVMNPDIMKQLSKVIPEFMLKQNP